MESSNYLSFARPHDLVQVTNTNTNPVVTQGIGNQSVPMLNVECAFTGSDPTSGRCYQIFPCSSVTPGQTTYTVPPGETFVVTAVDARSSTYTPLEAPCPSFKGVVLNAGTPSFGSPLPREWVVPANAGVLHFTYPSGLTYGNGAVLTAIGSNDSNSCHAWLDLYGYLTSN